jgi:hypothetical protein
VTTASTQLTNDELASIYDYLQGQITQAELCREVQRARTNTYYYVGRAMHYWLERGVLEFKPIDQQEELGGADV